MTFADFMERVTAKVRRDVAAFTPLDAPSELAAFRTRSKVLDLYDAAHVFNLGEADDFAKAGEELKDDLAADFDDGVPAPFHNMIVVFRHPQCWSFEWHIRLGDYLSADVTPNQRKNVWMLTDLSESVLDRPAFASCAWYKVLTSRGREWERRAARTPGPLDVSLGALPGGSCGRQGPSLAPGDVCRATAVRRRRKPVPRFPRHARVGIGVVGRKRCCDHGPGCR